LGRPSAKPGPGQLDLGVDALPAPQLPNLVARAGWAPPTELPDLRGARQISIDLETCDPELTEHGPGFRKGAFICGLAVGVAGGGRWYLPTRHLGGGNLDEGLIKRWAKHELGAFKGEVVGANLGYDLDGLATCWDVHLPNVSAFHDVQVAEPLLDEHRLEYSLDALAHDYLGEGKEETLLMEAARRYGAKTSREAKRVLWRLPAQVVGPYAEADVDLPLRIWALQKPRLEAEGLLEIYEVERQLIPILVAMRRHGVRVDTARAQEVRARLVKERDGWAAKLKHLAGPKAELTEPASIGPALEAAGVVVPRTAKTQQYSVTKPFLERYAPTVPLVQAVMAGRKLNTMISTFIDSQILGHATGGRVHPTFNQLKGDEGGTIARFSGSNPNLQFLPSREEDWQENAGLSGLAPLIRGLFLAEEDEDWQRDDFSQLEYRLLAHFAVGQGAEEAREAYRVDPKTDFHKMAASMLGVDPEDKVRRKRVKNTNFTKVYGGGIDKIAQTFNCTRDEAAGFVEVYDRKLPFVSKTYDAAMNWAERRGFVVTVLNRRQRFPLYEPRGARGKERRPALPRERALAEYGHAIQRAGTYMALNRKLQASGADIMKKGMVDAQRAGVLNVIRLLATVHDEGDSSVPRTRAGDEAGREFTRILERAVELRVPLYVDSERGADWGAVS
jgi:DNA polymerase I-like protein with 3'-5' exonuclease and polymerase domains